MDIQVFTVRKLLFSILYKTNVFGGTGGVISHIATTGATINVNQALEIQNKTCDFNHLVFIYCVDEKQTNL